MEEIHIEKLYVRIPVNLVGTYLDSSHWLSKIKQRKRGLGWTILLRGFVPVSKKDFYFFSRYKQTFQVRRLLRLQAQGNAILHGRRTNDPPKPTPGIDAINFFLILYLLENCQYCHSRVIIWVWKVFIRLASGTDIMKSFHSLYVYLIRKGCYKSVVNLR